MKPPKPQDKPAVVTISVRELIECKSDVHHIFPKDLLKKRGLSQSQYNQIANYVAAQSEINIQIGNKAPATYFREMWQQVQGGGHSATATSARQRNCAITWP